MRARKPANWQPIRLRDSAEPVLLIQEMPSRKQGHFFLLKVQKYLVIDVPSNSWPRLEHLGRLVTNRSASYPIETSQHSEHLKVAYATFNRFRTYLQKGSL